MGEETFEFGKPIDRNLGVIIISVVAMSVVIVETAVIFAVIKKKKRG